MFTLIYKYMTFSSITERNKSYLTISVSIKTKTMPESLQHRQSTKQMNTKHQNKITH